MASWVASSESPVVELEVMAGPPGPVAAEPPHHAVSSRVGGNVSPLLVQPHHCVSYRSEPSGFPSVR